MHAFNQRILAEDLVRVRRPDERERYAAAQRQARIDPNPHQIDAVIFALRRLREGGCILADEVGLGKTIEAGLVIAQRRAEGAQRILLIVPKSLIGQWQNELLNLFGIQAREDERSFLAPGVYLVGREFAGSERGATIFGAAPPFDLAVIDEAHEIFAGLHKRYGRDGIYDETSDEALMAHRVRGFYRGELMTFPSPVTRDTAVRYIHVDGGVYERGGAKVNRKEALAVVDEIVRRVKSSSDSIGIVTFNADQQHLIENMRSTPVLLLTATPMQNSLAELWGLVQYVEPTGTLLGDIATFRKVFCSDDDRTLVPGQEHELKRRLAMVQRRTLRRQAQEFLDRPFTQRRCRLYEYTMSDAERSLYDDVTEYLLEPSLFAFAGRQRRLLLIGFHRRMASSISALSASLENVAARLRRMQSPSSA
jgi:SNF2-related domain